MLIHQKLKIPRKNKQYLYGKFDLFAVVIALRYLIDAKEFRTFRKELHCLITSVLKQCPHIFQSTLYSEMGFPENWENISRYRKI